MAGRGHVTSAGTERRGRDGAWTDAATFDGLEDGFGAALAVLMQTCPGRLLHQARCDHNSSLSTALALRALAPLRRRYVLESHSSFHYSRFQPRPPLPYVSGRHPARRASAPRATGQTSASTSGVQAGRHQHLSSHAHGRGSRSSCPSCPRCRPVQSSLHILNLSQHPPSPLLSIRRPCRVQTLPRSHSPAPPSSLVCAPFYPHRLPRISPYHLFACSSPIHHHHRPLPSIHLQDRWTVSSSSIPPPQTRPSPRTGATTNTSPRA